MKKRPNYKKTTLAVCTLIFLVLTATAGPVNKNENDKKSGISPLTPQNSFILNQITDTGIPAKTFYAILIDDNNNKWFLTELGIVSYSGGKWVLHNENSKIGTKDLKDFAYEVTPGGSEFWVASPSGATVTTFPFDAKSNTTTYAADDASILSNNVTRVTIGKNSIRWFGTDKGVSAFINNKWLTPSYDDTYPSMMFAEYPITAMATSPGGDSLYVGTDGAGIARVFRNDVDGISGASVYAQWGPIILPSDKVFSIYIAPNGTKWFGTDQGVASHTGPNTLENWTVYTTAEGLINNFVQAITSDKQGNMWFGTKGGGISVFDGSKWTSYTTANGLNSNTILSLAVDNDGVVWIGTDNGVASFSKGSFITFK